MISKDTEAEVIKLYLNEWGGAQKIANKFGIAKRSVFNILKRNNIQTRPAKQASEDTSRKISEKIREKYDSTAYKARIHKHLDNLNSELTPDKRSASSKKGWTKERKVQRSKLNREMWASGTFVGHDLDEESRTKIAASVKNKWRDKDYREKQSTAHRKAVSSEAYKQTHRKLAHKRFQNSEYVERHRNACREKWTDDEYRKRCLKNWEDAEHREKMAAARSRIPRVSSLQTTLYSMLDDLGVTYFREYTDRPNDPQTIIGPWSFDCVIPRSGAPTLLIECQGDYWHKGRKSKDDAKASYIANNFPDKYELKYLWEHEFSNHNRVFETIKYWLGIARLESVNYSLNDVTIKSCEAKDYKTLLAKYHYLPNAGRGGLAYGAYLNGELIAVCVFSPLSRQNVGNNKTTRELSRLCVHPQYQKKNLLSWFITRCIKKLPPQYETIISYCDTTFNHNGAAYKASNFTLVGSVKPDYWYQSEDGWIMHKKTLYNKAVKMNMKESEFANEYGYTKVWGKEKLKFVLRRQ